MTLVAALSWGMAHRQPVDPAKLARFRRNIVAFREALHLSQDEVGWLVGFSGKYIYNLERGKNSNKTATLPPHETMEKLAKALAHTMEDLTAESPGPIIEHLRPAFAFRLILTKEEIALLGADYIKALHEIAEIQTKLMSLRAERAKAVAVGPVSQRR